MLSSLLLTFLLQKLFQLGDACLGEQVFFLVPFDLIQGHLKFCASVGFGTCSDGSAICTCIERRRRRRRRLFGTPPQNPVKDGHGKDHHTHEQEGQNGRTFVFRFHGPAIDDRGRNQVRPVRRHRPILRDRPTIKGKRKGARRGKGKGGEGSVHLTWWSTSSCSSVPGMEPCPTRALSRGTGWAHLPLGLLERILHFRRALFNYSTVILAGLSTSCPFALDN